MKTQCPHCQAKFEVADKYEDNKVSCPKCKQPFVIAPFSEGKTMEVCMLCSRVIGKLEQVCVFNGKIVCAKCDKKLGRRSATLEIADTQEKIQQASAAGELVKCGVCGNMFHWDEILKANYDPICKDCFKSQRAQLMPSRGKSIRFVLAGLGLYLLGGCLVVFAVLWFLKEQGSFEGTMLPGLIIFLFAVPCFKFGTGCLQEGWLAPPPWERRAWEEVGAESKRAVKKSRLANIGLILGCVSFFTCGITAIPGLVFSIRGFKEVKSSNNELSGKSTAILGIILNGLFVLMWAVYIVTVVVFMLTRK